MASNIQICFTFLQLSSRRVKINLKIVYRISPRVIYKSDWILCLKKSISWALPFLKMRLRHAVITEQVDLCFLKTPANIKVSDFPAVNNERFAVGVILHMCNVWRQTRGRELTVVGNKALLLRNLVLLAVSSPSLLWSFSLPRNTTFLFSITSCRRM